jgi:hypothetical protein
MKKSFVAFTFCFAFLLAEAQDIYINKDTVVKGVWQLQPGAILHFGSKGHISGSGTIRGGIIDAALGQWIFDTTVMLYPEGTYGNDFSARWFGVGRVTDNSSALQKGINTVLENSATLRNFFIPKGLYLFSKPLLVQSIYNGNYTGCTIHIYGASSFWDTGNGTTLQYTSTNGFAIGLQVNKGTEINNLIIKGKFKAPDAADAIYYNIPFEKYTDANNQCGPMYAGLVIDYDASKNSSGSTGLKIHDLQVANFSIDYLVSPNGKTFNADILLFENIRCGDAQVGFATGQAQEKGNIIRGIYSWGSLHTLYAAGRFGKSQAGHYTIDGANIAGRCIRLFDISQSGWYATSISNIFAESIATIGSITTQIPTAISNSTFHFVYPKIAGKQTLLYASSSKVVFNSCTFRYYSLPDSMKFAGNATYNNCFFSGPVVK